MASKGYSLEDWLRLIKQVKNPLGLTEILFADESFVDKVKILISLPKEIINDDVAVRLLEFQLENSGYHQLTRAVCWLSFYNLPDEYHQRASKWSNGIALGDTEIRRVVRREVFVQEKVKAIQKSLILSAGK